MASIIEEQRYLVIYVNRKKEIHLEIQKLLIYRCYPTCRFIHKYPHFLKEECGARVANFDKKCIL